MDNLQFRLATGIGTYAVYQDLKPFRGTDGCVSRFMLKGLAFTNISSQDVTLERCEIGFKTLRGTAQTTFIDEETVSAEIKRMKAVSSRPLAKDLGYSETIFAGEFTDSTCIKPGQTVMLGVQHFDIFAADRISSAEVRAICLDGQTVSHEFPITEYIPKQEYVLPMKGIIAAAGGFNGIISHRWATSPENEFAMDFHILDKDLKPYSNDPLHPSDYYCFGVDVLAPAAGKITDCADGIPDHPFAFNDEALQKLFLEQRKQYPPKQVAYGNYIVIDHGNSEFSLLCHLKNNSLAVKIGDSVQKGQVIARCGHSGGSDAPHLHYQLMNHANNAQAAGLPVSFSNTENAVFGETMIRGSSSYEWYKNLLRETGLILLREK